MAGRARRVEVTEGQRRVLLEFARSRTESRSVVQRAAIVLAAVEGRLNKEIAPEVGLNAKQVGRWRRRWQEAWEGLCEFERAEPRRLRAAIRETLADAPRSGRRPTFTGEQVCAILAIACEPPSLSGRPITHWTRDELADEAIRRGVVESISGSQVSRFLREAQLQPHRRKMWINTREKDPEEFQRGVEEVCETYLRATERFEEEGTRTVCCDEMTGVQALERAAPDQPPQPQRPGRPGQLLRREFEYVRHGTTTLIGNWDVVAGRTFANSLGPTRTEEDFVAHVERTVAEDPAADWVFVVDQLNTHLSAGLVEFVAGECEPDRELGKKGFAES